MSQSKWFKVECQLPQPLPELDELVWQWVADYDCLGTEIREDNTAIVLFFALEQSAMAVAKCLPVWLRDLGNVVAENIKIIEVTKTNWNEAWKQYFLPTRVGKCFVVLPPWEAPTAQDLSEGRLCLYIEPGMAFGTGTHATTQLCLRLLETIDLTDSTVLDIGTGSGILAIAARKRGARWCIGIDHDPDIRENAAKNLQLNGISQEDVAIIVGRPHDLKISSPFDVVLCNMLYHEAEPLFPLIKNYLRQDGLLCLSGFLSGEEQRVKHELAKLGFRPVQNDTEEEWAAALFIRS